MTTIQMNLTSAEEQHDIEAIKTELKWLRLCEKWRQDRTMPPKKES